MEDYVMLNAAAQQQTAQTIQPRKLSYSPDCTEETLRLATQKLKQPYVLPVPKVPSENIGVTSAPESEYSFGLNQPHLVPTTTTITTPSEVWISSFCN